MKTALSIVGIVFLVLLVIFGGVIGLVVYEASKLDSSSKAYVDESVPAIVTHWSKEELEKRESAQFRKATSDEDLTKLFVIFERLGALQSYDGCKGDANVNVTPGAGLQVTATYLAQATFENGKAEIKVILIQVHGEWQILGFRVDSSAFVK